MNNTHQSTSVMHSLNALWQWLMAKPGPSLPTPTLRVCRLHRVISSTQVDRVATSGSHSRQIASHAQRTISNRPLRVLQVVEAGQNPAQSGRLRISGRMADVCAELDRLAAREAPQH